MRKKRNYTLNGLHLIMKATIGCIMLLLCFSINNYAQEANNADPECFPTFAPCQDVNVLDFSENGYNWGLNDMGGSYTVDDQTFDININDPDGIFAAFQDVQIDPDDEGSYENNAGLAIGINPNETSDELEITYNLSLVSDYVAFTIRDLDRKYYSGSQQIESVCVYGFLDGVEVSPSIQSLCGSVGVDGNCAVGTKDSSVSGEDESIRVIFEGCINEIRIVYGNDDSAADDPTYSRIYIGDDIGFGTAVCSNCDPCTAEPAEFGAPDSVCLDENGIATLDEADITLSNAGIGENSAWVITDDQTTIIAVSGDLPLTLNGEGTYIVWYLNWDGDLSASPDVGANAGEIVGNSECAALSEPQVVNVENCCSAVAAQIELSSGDGTICVDDGIEEPIEVTLEGGNGENSAWVITDQNAIVLGLPAGPPFNLDDAGIGTCLIWYLNWDGELNGTLEVDADVTALLSPTDEICAELSNSIPIVRENCCTAASAQIGIVGSTDTIDICVNDENLQPVEFEVINAGGGANSAWVITDANGIILELSNDSPSLDFYASAEATCLVWYLSWDGDLASVPQVGDDANLIVANSVCAELSNSVTINRACCCPYTVQFEAGNLDCIAGNLFPEPVVFVDSNLVYPDTIFLADGSEILAESIACYSDCSGLAADIRNEMDIVIPGAVTTAGVYIASATCGDCAEEVRFEITQADIDGCSAFQQGILAPSICNGGMLADAPIVNSIHNNSATIQWNPQTNANLQYRATDSDQWISVTQNSGFVIIPNLGSCSEYEARLNYPCNNNMVTSLNQRFTTAGCVSCEDMSPELVPLNVSDNSAILSWDIVPGSMYTLYYKTDEDEDWRSYNTLVPFVVLFGLDECSKYEFGLKVTCSNARSSNMSSIVELGNDCEGQKTGSLLITDNSLINIYPNPASSFVDISLTNNATISTIDIYNASGKLIFNQNDLNFDGIKYTAKLNNLSKGLYFITATVEGKVHTKKFLKE